MVAVSNASPDRRCSADQDADGDADGDADRNSGSEAPPLHVLVADLGAQMTVGPDCWRPVNAFSQAVGALVANTTALRPVLVIAAAPTALRHRGLHPLLAHLAAIGYRAAWTVLPASTVGVPQPCSRLFLLAARQDNLAENALWLRPLLAACIRRKQAPHQAPCQESEKQQALAAVNGSSGRPVTNCGKVAGTRPGQGTGRGPRPGHPSRTFDTSDEQRWATRAIEPEVVAAAAGVMFTRPWTHQAYQPVRVHRAAQDLAETLRRWEAILRRPMPLPSTNIPARRHRPTADPSRAITDHASDQPPPADPVPADSDLTDSAEVFRYSDRTAVRLAEWLMGLPSGWVADLSDFDAAPPQKQLHLLSSGVVVHQAVAAIRLLLPRLFKRNPGQLATPITRHTGSISRPLTPASSVHTDRD